MLVEIETGSVMKLVKLDAGRVYVTVCAGSTFVKTVVEVTAGRVTKLVRVEAGRVLVCVT